MSSVHGQDYHLRSFIVLSFIRRIGRQKYIAYLASSYTLGSTSRRTSYKFDFRIGETDDTYQTVTYRQLLNLILIGM